LKEFESLLARSRRGFIGGAAGITSLMLTGAADALPAGDTVVEIAQGKLKGYRSGDIHVFKGVPYGAPPTGVNRFAPPQTAKPWAGVRTATQYGPSSMQFSVPMNYAANQPPGVPPMTTLLGWGADENKGEDCLVLNVWTPGLADGKKRPVMFRIHGGSFVIGSGSWPQSEGTALARRGDVVVVTVNHRLGALGFLYLAEMGDARFAECGNAGMLDLILALRWVRDNIAQFGGDPQNVMVFGESGGGMKIATLMVMPEARGLFHRAAIESAPRNALRTTETATVATKTILDKLGISVKALDELYRVPAEKFLLAESASLGPVVDGRTLPVHPEDEVASGSAWSVPLLIGSNRTESTLFEIADLPKIAAFDEAGMRARLAPALGANSDKIVNAYRRVWPKATPGELVLYIEADRVMRVHAIRFAERKMANSTTPVFMYLFNWRGNAISGLLKSCHGLEVPFTMDNADSATALSESPGSRELAARMSAAWIAFARSGDPTIKTLPPWPRYSLERRATMLFDNPSSIVENPFGELPAWDGIGVQEI
jgi:para-nitrobenzyl esterase